MKTRAAQGVYRENDKTRTATERSCFSPVWFPGRRRNNGRARLTSQVRTGIRQRVESPTDFLPTRYDRIAVFVCQNRFTLEHVF